MESLRFLMVTTHYPPHHIGGDAVFVKYLADELSGRGHEVHILSNPKVSQILKKGQKGPVECTEAPHVHRYRPALPRVELLLSYSLGMAGGARDDFRRVVREVKPDVVHWHNTKGFIPFPLPVSGVASLMTAHDYYPVCPRTNLIRPGNVPCVEPRHCQFCLAGWRRLPQPWRIGGNRVLPIPSETRVLAPSRFVADRLREDGIQVTSVLRNFVPDPGGAIANETAVRNTLAYVGILEPHKGLDTLIRAFRDTKDLHDFELVIVGGGSLEKRISNAIKDMELSKRVTLTGRIPSEELVDVIRTSAAVIMPSIWFENCPLVALESLSYGVPLIGSNIGGIPELLTEDTGSVTFEAGDVHSLSERITAFWQEMEGLSDKKARARRAYESRFRPDVHLSEYMNIIRGAVA